MVSNTVIKYFRFKKFGISSLQEIDNQLISHGTTPTLNHPLHTVFVRFILQVTTTPQKAVK